MYHHYTIKDKKLHYEQQNSLPIPSADELLIKVHAIGVNRADILQVEGKYPSPDGSHVPGLEVSGVDVASGLEVCALLTSGAYSEYVVAKRMLTFEKPKSFSFAEGACLPEAMVTVWLNLFELGYLIERKQTVLIHAGASGIGSFAIQAAKLTGAKVISTASTLEKQQFCEKLGADICINYADFTNYEDVDLILDVLGGEYINSNLSALKQGGKLIIIAIMEGSQAPIHLGKVLTKNIRIIGSTLRPKSTIQKNELLSDALIFFTPYFTFGRLRPIVDRTFAFTEAAAAHQYIKDRKNKGKIALLVQ